MATKAAKELNEYLNEANRFNDAAFTNIIKRSQEF